MDLAVTSVSGIPANCFISVRYGESRKQAPFRNGEVIGFPAVASQKAGGKLPKAYTVDVFQKLASTHVSLAGITALGGTIRSEGLDIPSLNISDEPLKASLTATLVEAPKCVTDAAKAEIATKAKDYLEKHCLQAALQDMFAQLIEKQPGDPFGYMIDFLEQQREEADERDRAPPDFAAEPGLGDTPYPGFGDGQALPDLSKHHSVMAEVLRKDSGLFEKLQNRTTSLGVTLATCVKPGVDCPGHELVKVAGTFAGDEESYTCFQEFFDPILSSLHSGWMSDEPHPRDGNPAKLTNSRVDTTGRYAIFASMEVRRNISGIRFPTCCSKQERRAVENLVNGVLSSGAVKGSYLPLRWSQSHSSKRGGMSVFQQERLRHANLLFTEPDSKLHLAAGIGRDWPDARGVVVGDGLHMWCNEEDHLRFFARQHGPVDIKELYANVASAVQAMKKGAEAAGYGFSCTDRLGFLTACPSHVGSAMRIALSLRVPLLAAATDLPAVCRQLDVHCSQEMSTSNQGSVWTISSGECLGISEVDLVNGMIESCLTLVTLEQRMERGEPIYDAMPGLGAEAPPGFSTRRCPARLPDLSCSHSVAAAVLRDDPAIYSRLRGLETSAGVGLAACIKPCVDDVGAASTFGAGIVAGDGDSYETFKELFDPVISKLHAGFEPISNEYSGFKPSSAGSGGDGVVLQGLATASVRVELRRNLRGLRLSPVCSVQERQEAERRITKCLLALGDDFRGEYYPLACSSSYVAKPGGVPWAEQANLRSAGLLFSEPTVPFRLAAGLGRDWPDARGAFVSQQQDLTVWCNEEDHVRIIVRQSGGDLAAALSRATTCAEKLGKALEADGGVGFLTSQRLGFLTVDPVNLGAFTCAATLRLAHLGTHPELPALCAAYGLTPPTWRPGAMAEVATVSSLGLSETDVACKLQAGCALLNQLESQLASGSTVDAEIGAILGVVGSAPV
jgi:creatine kinase